MSYATATPAMLSGGSDRFVPAASYAVAGASRVYEGMTPAWSAVPWEPEGHPGVCECKTKSGEPCTMPKAHDTTACVGHLNAIAAYERAIAKSED
jgi:hypothetical protein